MTSTGYSSRHCFMNAYLAATPSQRTPSLFLRYHAPGAPRPTPCVCASVQPPAPLPCVYRGPPPPLMPWPWPPSSPAFPWVPTGVLQPLPERALAPVPSSPPRPETRAYSLVYYDPFLPPQWLSLPIRSVYFFQGTSGWCRSRGATAVTTARSSIRWCCNCLWNAKPGSPC